MSPCPKCGAKARHVGVLVPWDGQGEPEVLHGCKDHGLFLDGA